MSVNADFEPKRSGNECIGEKVHTLMWRAGLKQGELGKLLHVDQGSVSKRLRGKTQWTAMELLATAEWLGVDLTDLLPKKVYEDGPDPDSDPASVSRLRESNSRPFHYKSHERVDIGALREAA